MLCPAHSAAVDVRAGTVEGGLARLQPNGCLPGGNRSGKPFLMARLGRRQHLQRLVHAQHVGVRAGQLVRKARVERHDLGVAAAPFSLPRTREVDDHRAHDARRVGEEVPAVVDGQRTVADELEEGLVDQRRGVKQVFD